MIEKLVRALIPPASREHVLGDLHERYRSSSTYLFDALRIAPFVVGSRIRRTTHPLSVVLLGAFLWWAVFYGNRQTSWLTASIPTLVALTAFALRDAYRTLRTVKMWRIALVDTAVAAASVLLSQAVLALTAPTLLLSFKAQFVGFPLGFIVLFFVRLQMPTGFHQPPGFARSLSVQELRTEICAYETFVRRAVRIEIGACWVVAAIFSIAAIAASTPIVRIGTGMTALGALFVWWFLHRHGRVRSLPMDRDFHDTLAAYRSDLVRRRRLALSYGWWYIAPLAAGPVIMFVGSQLRSGSFVSAISGALILGAVGAALIVLQRGFAAKMQQRIDQLGLVAENTAALS